MRVPVLPAAAPLRLGDRVGVAAHRDGRVRSSAPVVGVAVAEDHAVQPAKPSAAAVMPRAMSLMPASNAITPLPSPEE